MRVSIGIPIYNAESTLTDAIRSVFAQSFEDWELLLVDDGSTDHSLDIARAVDDPRVRVIADGANLGLQCRLNHMIDLACGEYFARMDADDIMHPQRIARQLDVFSDSKLDMVGTATYTIDENNKITGIRHTELLDTRPASVFTGGLILHPTAMGKTEWFRRNRYNESFSAAEDHELWCRTCRFSKFDRLQEPLFYYREGHKNSSKFLRSYRAHSRGMRRCYLMHGPAIAGLMPTALAIFKQDSKRCIYELATMLGLQDAAIRRRYILPMTDAQMQDAMAGLGAALSAEIPGLSREVKYANSN